MVWRNAKFCHTTHWSPLEPGDGNRNGQKNFLQQYPYSYMLCLQCLPRISALFSISRTSLLFRATIIFPVGSKLLQCLLPVSCCDLHPHAAPVVLVGKLQKSGYPFEKTNRITAHSCPVQSTSCLPFTLSVNRDGMFTNFV